MITQNIHIIGGGTFSHVRNHLALAAPAFGGTAKRLANLVADALEGREPQAQPYKVITKLTKMAESTSNIVTNDDMSAYVDTLIANPQTKIIIFNAALCDYKGCIGGVASGPLAERMKTKNGPVTLQLTPADKLISKIRKQRKNIFLVAFKTTTNATEAEQYIAGLNLLKANSCNLVLANDTVTGLNMIITPEESRYAVSTNRNDVLEELVTMTLKRSALTFTRSTVVPGDSVAWSSEQVPENLRAVVNHCIEVGAYKPFRGSTAGHFAVKLNDKEFLTSKRKTNYNNLNDDGLVYVRADGPDSVIAHGAKPSVGGQSQRIVFAEHPSYDCIVHFHCPPKAGEAVSTRPQQFFECGSHECGQNTSRGLIEVEDGIKVVYLDNHGPNVVFRKDVPAERVINYIDRTFDLSAKTGGPVA